LPGLFHFRYQDIHMAETELDSLVVRIGADISGLEQGLDQATRQLEGVGAAADSAVAQSRNLSDMGADASTSLGEAAEQAAETMAGAFDRMARRGAVSFDSLKSAALSSLAEIAAGALSSGLEGLFGGSLKGLGSSITSLFLPGRAGGGSVAARQPYMVGERGPELFVPEGAGRIDPAPAVRTPARRDGGAITINVNGVRDDGGLRKSATQVAVAVSRAIKQAERGL